MFPELHFQDTDIICGYEAGCLGYVPDIKDEEVRDYLRMRDDHQTALKQIRQRLNAFCLRHGNTQGN